jgi:asparagine synthetase B (glutamine-hydrolysing)
LGYKKDRQPLNEHFSYREVGRMFPESLLDTDNINNRQFVNLLYHSDGFCTVLDHMCGYYGMESRVPFLHQRLVKYLMSIPGQQKLYIPFNNVPGDNIESRKDYIFFMMGHYKGILREHLSHHYVPNVRDRLRKTGFSNPWDARDDKKNKMLREEQYQTQKSKLNDESVDFKDNLLYNLKYNITSERVNE